MGLKLIFIELKKTRILLIFSFFIFFTAIADAAGLKIHFIDVGEGEAILIQTPEDKAVLIDAGNFISGFKVIEYLNKYNIGALDLLIFTHLHLDHIGGAFFVAQMIEVDEIYDNGQDLAQLTQSQDVYRWYEQLIRNNSKYQALKAKDTFLFDGLTLEVLWPPQPFIFSDFNANSLVIRLEYKKFRCLLTGDLTLVAEKELLKTGRDLKANVLKIGHHGNNDASSTDFLKTVSPEISIISVNDKNIRGYPSREILDRLKNLGSRLLRTDRDGDILINVDEDGKITINTEKQFNK